MSNCIHCGEPLSKRTTLEECPTCRRSFYYWKNRRPAQRQRRRSQLELFRTRLRNWFPREEEK